MMNLLLVQHGQAKTEAEDPTRPLNAAGIATAEKVAKWLSASKVEVAEIRHSGKKRAEQTASIFAKYLTPRQGITVTSGLNPTDDVSRIASELKEYSGPVMLVGHLPFLSRLMAFLITGDAEREVVHFQNAGVVCLGENEGRWRIEWVVVPDLVRE